jgi:hypothetical protein
MSSGDVMRLEKIGLAEFKSQAHLYLSPNILSTVNQSNPHLEKDVAHLNQLLGWWALMQHYRAPTRLLDWTVSPYVAAYFAVEDHWQKDGAVWMMRVANVFVGMDRLHGILDRSIRYEDFWNPENRPRILVIRRTESTERMVAQQGCFTVCFQPLCDHADIIERAQPPEGSQPSPTAPHYLKIVIPRQLKPEILRRLRTMNIAAHALFPGIDGIGRSVAELIRVANVP